MKVPLSVIVPVLNEEKNIERCLRSIDWADEIFVIDSGSTDNTVKIAEHLGAKVVQFQYYAPWPKKKNWALNNLPLSHDWVFIIDADEELLPGSESEFYAICSDRKNDINGYYINRRFVFMGKRLRHAYYPNWNLRLFRHRAGRYEKLIDSETMSGDNEVHEHVRLREGSASRLKCEMLHYAFPTVEAFVEKHNRYSNWEAHLAVEGRPAAQLMRLSGTAAFRIRRMMKIFSRYLPFRPTARFLYIYIFQLGFLDGIEGYYFARLHAFYEFLCICKAYELRKKGHLTVK